MNVNRLRSIPVVLLAVVLAAPVTAQETEYTGADAVGLALRRLGTTGRVLMIGAHPDDENNAVLTALALGSGADVAYLSFTRGDGGQNLIGPELKEGLGLIRSEELLAARRLDGARQYFGREYDYGFSKSAEEAFSHWPRDSVLADAVEIIREFRPDVILSVWSGTPRDGHGQHQAAGIIAKAAFEAAADPSMFPGQIAAGLRPHRTAYLFQSTWRSSNDITQWIETGTFDPLFGRSWLQIAMESRSRHRSQDQGSAEPPGPQRAGLIPLGGSVPPAGSTVFAGLPATLVDWAAALAPRSTGLAEALRAWQTDVAAATSSWNPLRPDSATTRLEAALDAIDRAATAARSLTGDAELQLGFRIRVERAQTIDALRLVSGITLDATSDAPRVVPGRDFELTLRLWNGGTRNVRVGRLDPSLPAGWSAAPRDPAIEAVAPGEMATRRFRITVAPDADVSEAWYLEKPRTGDLYTWPADTALWGKPFEPTPIQTVATVRLDGHELSLETAAKFLAVDKALGERRLPILIVPAVNVLVDPQVAVAPVGANSNHQPAALPMTVTLEAEGQPVNGRLRISAPAGWSVDPVQQPVRLDKPGVQTTLQIHVTPPAGVTPGRFPVDAVFVTDAGARYARGFTTIDYPHIRPHLLFRDARATFSAFNVAVAPGLHVGYIEGAGDDGAAALARLGVDVEAVGTETLRSGDFNRFNVIVAGIRAYEVREDLMAANPRLLDWVQKGGTFIVQYNKQEFERGHFAPYPVSIGGSDRVTDEKSPVRLLDPTNPALTSPNRIGHADFDGWVQERGLYFLSRFDDRYTPLLEMNDPGEPPQRGILVVTKYGRGTYVYVALSLFRQLPEGVPGAYRLLANLVSLGAK
jgi:LmbE family N-acetylglucosaminyl deacetylase